MSYNEGRVEGYIIVRIEQQNTSRLVFPPQRPCFDLAGSSLPAQSFLVKELLLTD